MNNQGFVSAIEKPYRGIGDPVYLNTKLLISDALGLPNQVPYLLRSYQSRSSRPHGAVYWTWAVDGWWWYSDVLGKGRQEWEGALSHMDGHSNSKCKLSLSAPLNPSRSPLFLFCSLPHPLHFISLFWLPPSVIPTFLLCSHFPLSLTPSLHPFRFTPLSPSLHTSCCCSHTHMLMADYSRSHSTWWGGRRSNWTHWRRSWTEAGKQSPVPTPRYTVFLLFLFLQWIHLFVHSNILQTRPWSPTIGSTLWIHISAVFQYVCRGLLRNVKLGHGLFKVLQDEWTKTVSVHISLKCSVDRLTTIDSIHIADHGVDHVAKQKTYKISELCWTCTTSIDSS